MFQDYGKTLWRLASFSLIIAFLSVFSVATFALLQNREVVEAINSFNPNHVPAPEFNKLPILLSGVRYVSNTDGNYQITRMLRKSNQLRGSDYSRNVVISLNPEREIRENDRIQGNYLTLEAVGDCFVLPAPIRRVIPADPNNANFLKIANLKNHLVFQAQTGGYFRIETESKDSKQRWYYLFVSPVPSRHLDRSDRDWYLTQWNTQTTSNCGPTVAAMSVRWATQAEPQVLDIRQYLGWEGDGAVGLNDLQLAVSTYQVKSRLFDLKSPADIFAALERGHLVALVYNMAGLQAVDHPDKNFIGQYYNDHGGHYLAVKGYSLDKKYFIVYDPIPSDWAENRLRYADGVSMIGRNRYYAVDELWPALRTYQALEIYP